MKDNVLFQEMNDLISEKYSQDTVMLIATATHNVPSVRSVDTFYHDGSFWIVTGLEQKYVQEIINNKNVMISDGGHNRFWGHAEITGHPLREHNLSIREVFKNVFKYWYDDVNNEDLESVCYIKVTPYKGYIHKQKTAYIFDKNNDIYQTEPIKHHIDVKLQPFWD